MGRVVLCAVAGGAGGAAGPGAGGAGPAQHHAGAGEAGPGVGHEDRPERGGTHHRGRAAGRRLTQVAQGCRRGSDLRRVQMAFSPQRECVTACCRHFFFYTHFSQRRLALRSLAFIILRQSHVRPEPSRRPISAAPQSTHLTNGTHSTPSSAPSLLPPPSRVTWSRAV